MINLSLHSRDFIAAVEDIARGSNLRHHVWQSVYESIPQMSEDNIDFFWYYFRRDLWDNYFYNGEARFGAEDYLHALAALHRGNRSYVRFKSATDGKNHKALCYTFQSELCPLYLDGSTKLQDFDAVIPGKCVLKQKAHPLPVNEYVEAGKEEWWEDLSIYNKQL